LGLNPVPVFLKKRRKSFPLKGISISSVNHLWGLTVSKISSSQGKGKPIPSNEPLTGTEKKNPFLETLKNSPRAFLWLHQCNTKFEATQSTERFFSGRFSILQIKARLTAGFSFKEGKDKSQTKTLLQSSKSFSVKSPTPAPASKTISPFFIKTPNFSIRIFPASLWGIAHAL